MAGFYADRFLKVTERVAVMFIENEEAIGGLQKVRLSQIPVPKGP